MASSSSARQRRTGTGSIGTTANAFGASTLVSTSHLASRCSPTRPFRLTPLKHQANQMLTNRRRMPLPPAPWKLSTTRATGGRLGKCRPADARRGQAFGFAHIQLDRLRRPHAAYHEQGSSPKRPALVYVATFIPTYPGHLAYFYPAFTGVAHHASRHARCGLGAALCDGGARSCVVTAIYPDARFA